MILRRRPYDFVKRVIDVFASALGLIVTAPIQLAVAALVAIKLGRPVLFTQDRPGLHGRPFRLVKFRTMRDVDEHRGLVTNEQRLTSFGKKLRATSLDELPSLWNVLRGDMSLVGPRPLRMEYLGRYTSQQWRRHEVRPGVTGLAQISGRNLLDWESRFERDVEYVDGRSLMLDTRILLATFARVVSRSGVEGDATATMSAFMGTDVSGLNEHPLAENWLDLRVQWLSDERVRDGVSLSFVPSSEGMREWWRRAQGDTARRDWVYTDTDGSPVAMCGLAGVGAADVHLYIYVNPERQGCGYGKRSLAKLARRAQSFGAHRLRLEVKADNEAALALYRGSGFVEAGDANVPDGKIAMVQDLRTKREKKTPA